MKRAAAVLLALALTASLAACGDDGDAPAPVSGGTGTVPTASPTVPAAGGSAPASPPASAEPGEPTSSAVPFPADTTVDEQQPSGGPLSVTAVRVAPQDGYDRVVFELDGKQAGQPGWRVEYVDEPTQQGSGDPVEVQGEAVLAVTITGTGYPFDTGVDEVAGDPVLPSGLQVVQDVVLGAVFEGQYEAFVGTSARAPFRVFRLDDPARVVVDVRVEQ